MVDFWDVHGIWFIVFMLFFPRLTLLFSSVAFGGFWWWAGWLIAPRVLVAFLASFSYWETNPTLVVFAWLCALSGESGEKKIIKNNIATSKINNRSSIYRYR